MKIKNFFLTGVFALALTASLAVTSSKRFVMSVTYHRKLVPIQCNTALTYDNCDKNYTGPQCTVLDPESSVQQPAFERASVYGGPDCTYPVYKQF